MRVDIRPISEIKTAKYNPRKINEQQLESLKASISRFGFVDPVIVNDRTGTLVGGHQRIKAAKALGLVDVPVVGVSLDEAEEKALNVALNKISGEWDIDLLRGVLEEIIADGLDISLTGFTDEEWSAMSGNPAVVGLTDPDDVPEVDEQAPPMTKPGDVWILGRHRLMCGDSTKADDVARLMGGVSVDLIWTDPPYGVSIVRSNKIGGDKPFGSRDKRGTVGASNIVKANEYAPIVGDDSIETALKAFEVIKTLNAKVEIIWGGNYYASALDNSSCWIVWDKENTGNFADAELAWTNQKTAVRVFKHMWNGMLKDSEHGQKRVHPTQKPVKLAEWCLDQYGKECSVVLDLFCGSGAALIACETSNKSGYMMEMSPDYCDVIVKRWENFTGKKAARE